MVSEEMGGFVVDQVVYYYCHSFTDNELMGEEGDKEVPMDELQEEDETLNVLKSNEYTEDYKYDQESYLWCELTFHLPLMYKSVDLTNTMREVAAKSVIWEVPRIKRAITYLQNDQLTLKTEGINIVEMFQFNKILDLNRLYSNDIHGIAETYGIEAAGRVLVKVGDGCDWRSMVNVNLSLFTIPVCRRCKTCSRSTASRLIRATCCSSPTT